MGKTPIEWTDQSWNPTRGCRRLSPGCLHCYAQRVAYRFSGAGRPYEGLVKLGKGGGPVWTGAGRFVPDALDAPLHWRAPQMIFVNSMSDLFYEAFTDEQIAAVFQVMALAHRHTFQVLTKRLARAAEWFAWLAARAQQRNHLLPATWLVKEACEIHQMGKEAGFTPSWPLPNVWLVASAEDQATADERIPELLRCPAAVRGVSYEPALEAVDFSRWLPPASVDLIDAVTGLSYCPTCGASHCEHRMDWLATGGESGPRARDCNLAWLRGAVAQARRANVPVFVKQLGARPLYVPAEWPDEVPADQAGNTDRMHWPLSRRDKKGGDMAAWPEGLRLREFPAGFQARRAAA